MLPFSKILVLGKSGQLASSFRHFDQKNEITFLGQDDINVQDLENLYAKFDQLSPELIINCMAYTKVDLAETEKEFCKILNTDFPFAIGRWCEKNNKKLIHFSTDYVFDGQKQEAYLETDAKNPLNVYGKTKSDGEDLLMSLKAEVVIFRISWVYSPFGTNFLKTMIKLGSERENLKIVSDQIGGPCSALDVARSILQWISSSRFLDFKTGIYHLTPGDTKISWCKFAEAIFSEYRKQGGLLKIKDVEPIKTEDYPTTAIRPKNSLMASGKAKKELGVGLTKFEDALGQVVSALH